MTTVSVARAFLGTPSLGRPRALPPSFRHDPAAALRIGLGQAPDGRQIVRFYTALREVSTDATPELLEALSGVGLGDVAIDEKEAKRLLGVFDKAEEDERIAEAIGRERAPYAAAVLRMVEAYRSWFATQREIFDRIKAAAQKAVLLGTPGSATDREMALVGDMAGKAAELRWEAELSKGEAPATVPTVTPAKPPAADESMSTIAKIGIGVSLAGLLVGVVTLLSRG